MSQGEVRTYGTPPFTVALIHGGPGAPGYMAPVARVLAGQSGVLEPLQSADSLDGQIEELIAQLRERPTQDLTLIGSSWGATLALLVAARNELSLRKLILIGSAVFDARSSEITKANRINRMSTSNRERFLQIQSVLKGNPEIATRDTLLTEMVGLLDAADFFDPISTDLEVIEVQAEINRKVWGDFVLLRDQPGKLQELLAQIEIPVVIIHGDYDPHPLGGVEPFLRSCISHVTTHLLNNCGHYPWMELQAQQRFFTLLHNELEQTA